MAERSVIIEKLDIDITKYPAENWVWCEDCGCHMDHCECSDAKEEK